VGCAIEGHVHVGELEGGNDDDGDGNHAPRYPNVRASATALPTLPYHTLSFLLLHFYNSGSLRLYSTVQALRYLSLSNRCLYRPE
jgi:hypothetical protein